jgi:hypothetical protein
MHTSWCPELVDRRHAELVLQQQLLLNLLLSVCSQLRWLFQRSHAPLTLDHALCPMLLSKSHRKAQDTMGHAPVQRISEVPNVQMTTLF